MSAPMNHTDDDDDHFRGGPYSHVAYVVVAYCYTTHADPDYHDDDVAVVGT